LAVPNFEEQKQIVEREKLISAEVNAAIAIKENQITKLNEYKVTLINAAVTGKIKVPEQYFSKDVYGGRYGQ
jgi:type I restriction enzyme S subunit